MPSQYRHIFVEDHELLGTDIRGRDNNLIKLDPEHGDTARRVMLAAMVAKHLCLFVGGKMAEAEIGEFCCSSRNARTAAE